MKDFFYSVWIMIRNQYHDWFGVDFVWIENIKETIQGYIHSYKQQESFFDRIGWMFGIIFELWIFWIIVIPIMLFLAQFTAIIQVILAKIYLSIRLIILPFLLLIAIWYFIPICYAFFIEVPRFTKKRRFTKKLCYVLFLSIAFMVDTYYHPQIENFLLDKTILEVHSNDNNNQSRQ